MLLHRCTFYKLNEDKFKFLPTVDEMPILYLDECHVTEFIKAGQDYIGLKYKYNQTATFIKGISKVLN